MHARPDAVTIRIANDRHAHITFFGPTLPPEGATTTLPQQEVLDFVARWFSNRLAQDAPIRNR